MELHLKDNRAANDSFFALSLDLLTARVLVWLACVGRDAELTPDAHLYFFDRYSRLSYYRAHGRLNRARRLAAKADEHYRAAGGTDGPPYAAAMAMPRPSRFVRTNAVSGTRLGGPDDAA